MFMEKKESTDWRRREEKSISKEFKIKKDMIRYFLSFG